MVNKRILLFLAVSVSSLTARIQGPIISAVDHLTDDQIVQQLVVVGCEEKAVKQLIKAIDASLEARNNSDEEEQEEREWRSAVIKYGLIATVGVVGIVWLVQMYKKSQHNQQQNQHRANLPIRRVGVINLSGIDRDEDITTRARRAVDEVIASSGGQVSIAELQNIAEQAAPGIPVHIAMLEQRGTLWRRVVSFDPIPNDIPLNQLFNLQY